MFDNALSSVTGFFQHSGWVLSTPAGALGATIAILAVIAIGIAISKIRFVHNIILAIPALYLFIIGLFGPLLWWPARKLTDLAAAVLPLDRMIGWLLLIPLRSSASGLVQGDRRYVAERIWPPTLYPDLYAHVPADIVRPVYEDGRLLGGVPLSWLADRFMTSKAYRENMRLGLVAGVVLIVLLLLQLLINGGIYAWDYISLYSSGQRIFLEQWPGRSQVLADGATTAQMFREDFWVQLRAQLGLVGSYLPAQIMMAVGAFLLSGLMLLNRWFEDKTSPYQLLTKDAEVRWPHRIESRNLIRQTYLRQVELANGHLKDSPTFLVGYATGTLRVRGDLAAPMRGQPLMLDQESLFQHTLVFGGTGEGKTTALLKPLMRQVLANKAYGAFVSDAKGVLWRDAQKVAKDVGRENDVVLIGTGANQFGVNIVSGLTPSQVAAALRSVLTQLGGTESDTFWPDMASGIIRHMLTLGQGYARTEIGSAEIQKGLHPYSLWWAYQAILRKEIREAAISELRAAHESLIAKVGEAKSKEEIGALTEADARLMTPELRDTIAYLESAWRDMAPETKTGIVANVTQLLDGFASSAVLRERFASGRDEKCITMRQALDKKIVVNTLSSIEDGLPARLVSILIKTSLYREARQRETDWKRQQTGVAPQSQPCLVVMDEVQELVTSDPSSGLSDASFWNVARSTGLAGLFATQTVAALRQAMGEHAADNFTQQARSKIFFRTEEKETVEFACWCAASYERNRVFGEGQRESIEYRGLIDGWDPLGPVQDDDIALSDPARLRKEAGSLFSPGARTLGVVHSSSPFAPDLSFIPQQSFGGEGSANASYLAAMAAQQAAFWRAEDLEREYLKEGNEMQAALTVSDLIHMGRWHAFAHIQRAGAVRQDLIVITHDFT